MSGNETPSSEGRIPRTPAVLEPGTAVTYEGHVIRIGRRPSGFGSPGDTYFELTIADGSGRSGGVSSLSGAALERAAAAAGIQAGNLARLTCVYGEVFTFPDGHRCNRSSWSIEITDRSTEEEAAGLEPVGRVYSGTVTSIREYPSRYPGRLPDFVLEMETAAGRQTLRRGNLRSAVAAAGITEGSQAEITHVGNRPFTAADGSTRTFRVWKARLAAAAPAAAGGDGLERAMLDAADASAAGLSGDDDIPF